MALSGVYDNQLITEFTEREIKFAVFQIVSVCEIKQNRTTYCTCHLIHHSGSLVPVYIFCVLTDFCIIIVGHFTFVEEVINNRADQHFKGCRRADTRCGDNIGAYISVKAGHFESVFLRAFHHTGNKGNCAFLVIFFTELCEIYNDLISVAFTCDMNYLCIIRVCSSDGIKVDTSCNYFTTIVICMVSDNFSSSGGSKVFCFVLFVDFLKMICKIFKTDTAYFGLSVNFLKFCCFR